MVCLFIDLSYGQRIKFNNKYIHFKITNRSFIKFCFFFSVAGNLLDDLSFALICNHRVSFMCIAIV